MTTAPSAIGDLHTLGVSLVHNPHTPDAQVLFTALYDNVGGPLEFLCCRQPHFECSVFVGQFVENLRPAALRETADDYAPLGGIDGVQLLRLAMAMTVGAAHPDAVFACFAQRNQVPYPLHDDLPLLLPQATGAQRLSVYRLFDTGNTKLNTRINRTLTAADRAPHLKVVSG